jgi:predicted kinase
MSSVIIPVGVPGCGKTTRLELEARYRNAYYLCPDDIREEMTGDAINQYLNESVWNELFRRLQQALSNNEDVIIDATNTHSDQRRFLTRFCRIFGGSELQLELWWFTTSVEECKRRNALRERIVPEYAIDRMVRQLIDDPIDLVIEGYDVVVFI